MKASRILFISLNMPWQGGGTFYRAFGLAKQLVSRGHTVTLLTTDTTNKLCWTVQMEQGVTLALAPSLVTGSLRSGYDMMEALRRIWWLRGRSYDLVHGFESRPTVIYPALYAARQSAAPLILDWCDWFGRGGSVEERGAIMRTFLRPIETHFEENYRTRAQGTTVINTLLAERARGLEVRSEQMLHLPNGIELEKFRPMPTKTARQHLNLPDSAPLIAHVGQAFPRDAKLMGDAFRTLHKQMPEAKLLLIGNHKTDIAAHFDDLRTSIIETGFVSDEQLTAYLSASDIAWLPLSDTLSNRGRWPLKINAYLASGRAIVSTNVGEWTQLFEGDRPIGALSAATASDLAQKSLNLLNDSAARHAYGSNALWHAQAYAWERVTDRLERFYEKF